MSARVFVLRRTTPSTLVIPYGLLGLLVGFLVFGDAPESGLVSRVAGIAIAVVSLVDFVVRVLPRLRLRRLVIDATGIALEAPRARDGFRVPGADLVGVGTVLAEYRPAHERHRFDVSALYTPTTLALDLYPAPGALARQPELRGHLTRGHEPRWRIVLRDGHSGVPDIAPVVRGRDPELWRGHRVVRNLPGDALRLFVESARTRR